MAMIAEHHLERLRASGLLVSSPFVSDHVGFPDGVSIAKPNTVKGNSLPDWEWRWGTTDTILDAPILWFHRDNQKWIVTCQEYVPTPGPGDFVNQWDSAEDALADILDYYFGNPARMEIKRKEWVKFKKHIDSFDINSLKAE